MSCFQFHSKNFPFGGGLICLFLWASLSLKAQLPPNTPITLPCNKLRVVVCSRTNEEPQPSGCAGCPASAVDCHRMQYEVKLRAESNSAPPGTLSFTLAYTDLQIEQKLVVASGGSGMTRINAAETYDKNCAPPDLGIDEDAGITALHYMTGPGLPPPPVITFTRTNLNDPFFCTLYTLVVDVFPNDIVSLDCPYFQYADGENVFCFSKNPPIPNNPNTIIYSAPGPYQFSLSSDGNVLFGFGPPILLPAGNPTSAQVPVHIRSTRSDQLTMNYVDFVLKVTSPLPIPPPTAQNALGFDVKFVPSTGLHTEYFVKVRRTGGNLIFAPNQTIPLFQLVLTRPNPQNAAATIDLDYQAGRFKGQWAGESSVCRSMSTENPLINDLVIFPGDPGCSNSAVRLNVTGTQGATSNNCNQLFIKVKLDLPSNSEVKELRFKIAFDLGGSVTIDKNGIINTLPCAGLNAECPATGSACYDIIGGNLVYCFKTTGAGVIYNNSMELIVPFIANSGCINGITITEAKFNVVGIAPNCIPAFDISGFPACTREVSGRIGTKRTGSAGAYTMDCLTPGYGLSITGGSPPCSPVMETINCGPYAKCLCGTGTFTIIPSLDENPLYGVSTFDLVLISKHILGIEPLNDPFKIIAADANKSGSVTTFDIVEFRKLILGIYDKLPANTSWRFFPKNLQISDPNNPFASPFAHSLDAIVSQSNVQYFYYTTTNQITTTHDNGSGDFIAVKVGDVNCSVPTCSGTCNGCGGAKPASPVPYRLETQSKRAKAGQALLLPVYAAGDAPLIALQAGIRFDPARFEFIGVSAGNVPALNAGCFNLQKAPEGEIKFLWLSKDPEEEYLSPGRELFFIALKAKTSVGEGELPIWTDESLFEGVGYTLDEQAFSLETTLRPEASQRNDIGVGALTAQCSPNPFSGALHFTFSAEAKRLLRLSVFGPFGERVFYRETSPDTRVLQVEEAANWPVGIYTWQLHDGVNIASGRVIKL